MEKNKTPAKSSLIFSSSSSPAPPPTPIPTGKGSRSAADEILSKHIDKSIRIPKIKLPQHVNRLKPEEINYESVLRREKDSVTRLLRSGRQFGVFRLIGHGISREELRIALGNSERIFGLRIECCASYGDHEKLVWSGYNDHIMEAVSTVIGDHNFHIFRQKMENVASQLEAIAQELAKVIAQNGRNQFQDPIQLGESTLSIYRYHRANIIDRISSVIEESSQESGPYALSLHLLLESGEFCLQPGRGNLSFDASSDTIIVTMGKELEDWSQGEFKSAQGKLMFKPFLRTNRPSFSIEQRWSTSKFRSVVGESNKVISLIDQVMILLFVTLLYNSFVYIYS